MSRPADQSERVPSFGSVLGYAPWVLRDYVSNQGAATVIVVLLIGFLAILPLIQGFAGEPIRGGQVPLALAARMLHAIVPQLVVLGTLFATNGLVANDRKHGYYRFLFAKPVSPPLYYAMVFFVYGVGMAVAASVLMGIWSLTVRPMFPPALLAVVFVMYVAYGGIGFLLSAAFRFDWLSLVTALLVANIGWAVWGNATGLRHWVLYALPPVHRASDVYQLVLDASGGVPWGSIAWLAGYGLACFLLGMLVIRRRPLGIV